MNLWLKNNINRYFADPQAIVLAFLVTLCIVVVWWAGNLLMPLLVAMVFAYLLDAAVNRLTRYKLPHLLAVCIVFSLFCGFVAVILFALLPLLWQQVADLVANQKSIIASWQETLLQLPQHYPEYVKPEQIQNLFDEMRANVAEFGQWLLSQSLNSLFNLAVILVYLILVPLLIFFLLKDKEKLQSWFVSLLPKERSLAENVWKEVDWQLGRYVRGKFAEILIIWAATYVAFAMLGVNYALLLGALVGLSVVIPYIGAAVVTIPVAIIAYFQWGWSSEFGYVMLAYAIIQAIDGNVLVPLLFSEAVNLHPVAIIAAVLFFGGLWGFWGVFFAIPLATVVSAIMSGWGSVVQATDEAT